MLKSKFPKVDAMMIHIPNSLNRYNDYLESFFEGMMKKLDKNSHKETPTTKNIPEIIAHLRAEIIEFEEQFVLDKHDENSLIELMDVANFAFLAYVALRMQGVEHAE